jgi:hypothetical protein
MQANLPLGLTAPSSNPLIGLRVTVPVPCRCGGREGVVGSSRAMHAGALHCASCQRFMRWLPTTTLTFISETVARFGAPTEPIVLRDHIPGAKTMEYKPNTGALFKNTYKKGDTHPDYKGTLNVAGGIFEISGWINESPKAGKFVRLSVKLKDRATTATAKSSAPNQTFDDPMPF